MKVTGFTYLRNGIHFDYPYLESIKSILPLVDEMIVVVGDSFDGTRKTIESLKETKIKIVDTIWDEKMKTGGYIFSQQSNIGLDNVSKDADWLFHIQADEVVHEKDHEEIRQAMEKYLNDGRVEGFLFDFKNFFGDFMHVAPSRRFHQKEIRIIRNDPHYRSFKDSQGFRKFNNAENYLQEKGEKLHVVQLNATIYHYSYVKDPCVQLRKHVEFGKRYNENDDWIEDYLKKNADGYDYGRIDFLCEFKGTHPAVMQKKVTDQYWTFKYDPLKNNMNFKEKLLKVVQNVTGKQFFINRNYKTLKL